MPTLRPSRNRVYGLANFKVLDPQVHAEGFAGSVGAADLEACSGQVNLAQEVGRSNAKRGEICT